MTTRSHIAKIYNIEYDLENSIDLESSLNSTLLRSSRKKNKGRGSGGRGRENDDLSIKMILPFLDYIYLLLKPLWRKILLRLLAAKVIKRYFSVELKSIRKENEKKMKGKVLKWLINSGVHKPRLVL